MCIDLEGHHSGGSSFVNVNDFCYYRNCLYNHRYKFSSEKEQVNESQYIVSRPGLGSDSLFGSDRGSGCDKVPVGTLHNRTDYFQFHISYIILFMYTTYKYLPTQTSNNE